MKFVTQTFVTILLAVAMEMYLPWWSIAIAAALGGFLVNSNMNFLAGFTGIAVLWFITSTIIKISAGAPLIERVAAIFSLSEPLLFVVTAFIGGLVGGFASMAGGALHKPKRKARYY